MAQWVKEVGIFPNDSVSFRVPTRSVSLVPEDAKPTCSLSGYQFFTWCTEIHSGKHQIHKTKIRKKGKENLQNTKQNKFNKLPRKIR